MKKQLSNPRHIDLVCVLDHPNGYNLKVSAKIKIKCVYTEITLYSVGPVRAMVVV